MFLTCSFSIVGYTIMHILNMEMEVQMVG